MNVIILAGGLGTRLHPITKDKYPKCMVSVDGKPFLEYLINHITQYGITNIILSIGHKAEYIKEYFNKWNNSIYFCEEKEPLGTGGAIKFVLHGCSLLKGPFIIINGDTIVNVNLEELMLFHKENKALITMAVRFVADVSRFGNVFFDKNKRMTEYKEKANSMPGYINAGVYILEQEIEKQLPDKGSFEKDFLQKIMTDVYVYDKCGDFIDIGIPEDYNKFVSKIKERND